MAHLTAAPARRARRSFWALVLVAVLAAGSLTAALTAEASPATGLRVGLSGIVLIASVALATRVMLALDRAHRRQRQPGPPGPRRLQ
ncbi:MAG TPA: hypothetical protein VFJ94_12820 [Intrasporangium sp.]|uniref:hypothetical protein n=1 Tax=Intrasporangium sp. TaxID=1925024 RepID=UPI002D785CD3|nr:hypothetical protein [Intrasporangium sp.]HET7399394.1 hypothetical protein [Intrasporangium sp.]